MMTVMLVLQAQAACCMMTVMLVLQAQAAV